jgi:hypothetical protein
MSSEQTRQKRRAAPMQTRDEDKPGAQHTTTLNSHP